MFVAGPRAVRWSAGVVGVLVVLATLGVAGVSYVAADKLVHPAREHPEVTPASRGLEYETATLLTEDGLRLSAWWVPASDPTAAVGTVIFLHGYGASKSQSLAVAPFLHRAGYHVLAFDFRAHGESEGAYTTIGIEEAEDVRAAVSWALARTRSDMPIALFGWSMGAATALNAAGELPEVDALVLDSSFARLANVVANNLEVFTGLPRYPFAPIIMLFASGMAGHAATDNEPAREAGALERPILIIQGTEDRIALPDDDGRALAEAAGDSAQLWLVQGAGHVDARRADPREYEERVVAFLEEHLSG